MLNGQVQMPDQTFHYQTGLVFREPFPFKICSGSGLYDKNNCNFQIVKTDAYNQFYFKLVRQEI